MKILLALSLTLFSVLPPAFSQPFLGQNCALCHARIRDDGAKKDKRTPELTGEKFDVVVVGGGLAGLSASYFLKDLNVLLLEKQEKVGGHARYDSWKGIPYATAVVYYNEEPYGVWKKLFDELELKPISVPGPQDVLHEKGRKVFNYWDEGIKDLPWEEKDRQAFIQYNKDMESFCDTAGFVTPVENSSQDSWKYDEMTFHGYLREKYGEKTSGLLSHIAKDYLGASGQEISAFNGLAMMCTGSDYFTWPGGVDPFIERISEKLGKRVRTSALVTNVEPLNDKVFVDYERDGKTWRVEAGAVVMATPAHVTRKILKNKTPEKDAALAKVRYSVYATAMLGFKEPVWTKSYMIWSPENTVFSSVVFAQWPTLGEKHDAKTPQVVVAYMPMGSETARRRLLAASDKTIEKKLRKDFEKILPGSTKKLEEVRIVRWGHAEPIQYPGYLSKVRPKVAAPMGRVFFAGEHTEINAIEGAIFSADRAQKEVRKFLNHKEVKK